MKNVAEVNFDLCIELTALREENERLKSESFEELYNAAIDERDAMREELTRSKELTMSMADRANQFEEERDAAEQRNADLIDLIQKAHTWVDRNNFGGWDAYGLRDQLAAALKPTESGAGEQKCCDRFPKCVCYEGADGL